MSAPSPRSALWRAVYWPQCAGAIIDRMRSAERDTLLLRVRQDGRVFDIARPTEEIAPQLQQAGLDLEAKLDVELRSIPPTQAIPRPDRSGCSPDAQFVDKDDCNSLQWNGQRGTGERVPHSLRQTPMFFRENGMNVDMVDQYLGQSIFLVLNGSSLTHFDWDQLRRPGLCSFGVNNGAHQFRPHFWTCVDDPTRFMESIWRDPTITKFVPMAHFQKPIWDIPSDSLSRHKVRDFPNVIGFRRNEAFRSDQWLVEDTVNWGNHSRRGGGRSVMLAALRIIHLLGFRRVYLVGCDFAMDRQHRYWFPEDRSAKAISNNQRSYTLLAGYFDQLQPHFIDAGFLVYNTNRDSHLHSFPYLPLTEAIAQARIDTSGSTLGMYVARHRDATSSAKNKRARGADSARGTPASPSQILPLSPTYPSKVTGLKAIVSTHTPRIVSGAPDGTTHHEPMDHETIVTRFVEVVRSATIENSPFLHIRLSHVFPSGLYMQMLQHLPGDSLYSELRHHDAIQPDGHSARLRFSFTDKEMSPLASDSRSFWTTLVRALEDSRIETALRQALAGGLRLRFGKDAPQIRIRPVPVLIRDFGGYRIRAHTDIFQKAITTQVYLASDSSQRHLGTTFYERDDHGQFKECHTLPFLANTGYAFAVHDHSWHGVHRLKQTDHARNSLMLTYYLDKN